MPERRAARTSSPAPLFVHFLFHKKSTLGRALAKKMFEELTSSPNFPGPRIPVLYARDDGSGQPPTLDSVRPKRGSKSLVCLLADDCMAKTDSDRGASAWGRFAQRLLHGFPSKNAAVLPVAIDGGAFHLHGQLARTSFVRLDVKPTLALQASELFFQVAVHALELLAGKKRRGEPTATIAPLRIFVSHAKGDLQKNPESYDQGRSPVLALLDYLAQGPVQSWFDSSQIRPGQHFDREIAKGVGGSTAFVAVHTDLYASREWCRREYLQARRDNLPIVVVNALDRGEPVPFPYFGNVPTLRWRSSGEEISMPRQVMHALLRETLHHRLIALQDRRDGRHRIALHPDLFTLQTLPKGCREVIHPDPPLPQEMRQVLHDSAPHIEFSTPLTRGKQHDIEAKVGLSISEASDIHRFGMGSEHLEVVLEDVACLLLLNGAQLGYGGWMRHGHDYTTALLEIARTLRSDIEASGSRTDLARVVHFLSWPKQLDVTDADRQHLYRTEVLRPTPVPEDLPMRDKLAEQPSGFFRKEPKPEEKPWSPALQRARQYAHARGANLMRLDMNEWLDARVCVGGKLKGYNGLVPGIVEEAWLALRAGKPVFLLGAFGGAAELVFDVMAGKDRKELEHDFLAKEVPGWRQLRASYQRQDVEQLDGEQIAKELRKRGLRGLRNGLTLAENEDLHDCTDPFRIVALIAQGLAKVGIGKRRRTRPRRV